MEEEKIPLANTLTAPGKKLGDYELLRFIRSEGDTEVHEALQLSIDSKVALILLNPKLSKNEDSVNLSEQKHKFLIHTSPQFMKVMKKKEPYFIPVN